MGQKSKDFLKGIVILLISLWGLNVSATTYYVSNSGNDANNGRTPATAWSTITKVEATTFLPGDSVLFRAGDCWRDEWIIDNAGAPGNYIYFGRYGTGKNPAFLGSEKAMDWTASGVANVWQSGTSLQNRSDDYYAGRLFFMDGDTIVYGDYKPYVNLSELTEEFDYTANGTVHYVFSKVDPDIAYDSIEVTQRDRVVNLDFFESYLEFNGIDIMFGQRSGFWSGYPEPRGATDLVFRNCFIGYTGAKGSGSAYGLAAFHSNMLVENCRFSDNGRRAISINTYTDNPGGRRIENIIIRNNKFYRGHHTTSLDLSTMNRTGDTVMNVYFYNNYIDDSGIDTLGNWGNSNQLFTQAGIGTSLMTNIYIVGNVFVQATARNIQLENGITYYLWHNTFVGHNYRVMQGSPYGNIGVGGADILNFVNNIGYCNLPNNAWENNILHGYQTNAAYPNRDYNLYYSEFPKADRNFTSIFNGSTNSFFRTTQWATYRSQFPAYDAHSPVPQNPDFLDYDNFNFRLSDTSAAKFAGVVIPDVIVTDPFGVQSSILKFDIDGNLRNSTNPSIGAYEYSTPSPTAANITGFSLSSQTGTASINSSSHTVNIQVRYGTDVTALSPSISVSPGATINPLSGVSRNFSTPQTYTVTAQDGTTQQNWIVTVTVAAPSAAANILTFTVPGQTGTSVINTTNRTISAVLPAGSNLTSISPTITVSTGATINPASGVATNFSSPVNYTVTAQDGTTQLVWTVTIISSSLSSEADILTFSLPGQTGTSEINVSTNTIYAVFPAGSDVTNIAPTISVSTGATINPASGVARNFSSTVTYTVTAQNGATQKVWTVVVTVEPIVIGNRAPVVDVEYTATAYKGLVYTIDASNSYDLDNQSLSFSWEVPSEIAASALTGPSISILPTENSEAKVYTIVLRVSDGVETVSNSINLGIYNFNPNAVELKIKSIEASNYETGNEPENILDNNQLTRWSADGDNQWIIFELDKYASISHFEVSFYNGENRVSYFDVFASSDKETWDLIIDNSTSCGFSPNMHAFEISETKASNTYKYIKLVGHMNSVNTWNSFTEFKSFGFIDNEQNTSPVKDLDKADIIEVYPNPATEDVYVKTGGNSAIRIIDLTGTVIYEQNNASDLSKIDIDFKSGVYFVQIIDANNKIKFTQKLIVK